MPRIYVLHENDAWVVPLRTAFEARDLPYEEWFLDRGIVAFDRAPPAGVFYNRMSASSHTRGHRYGPELAHGVLTWLEAHERRVVNGTRALYLEVSKLAQYAALNRAGITTPRTVAAVGRDAVLAAARDFGPGPWILKPNRGGKGLGVQLFHSLDAMAAYLDGPGA
ncbi:MAG: alpha-L-glutamate ligase, partial [Alphaproteobacteria bacterium]